MLVLLQFDAASLQVVQDMLASGRLPHIEKLRRRGKWETMDAEATFLQSATYPSLYTGVDVRQHGIYSTFPWSPSEQRTRHAHSFPKPSTVWERLTVCGKKSLVIDPYISWAPKRMCGFFLSGFQFEDRMALRSAGTPRAASTLARRHGATPVLHDVYGRHSLETLERMRDQLIAGPRRAAGIVDDALRRDRFDMVWVNFAGAHKGGHHLWDAEASTGEKVNPGKSAALRKGLEEIYREIDESIGAIVERLPDDADVIVFSPTGMSANTSRADLLPSMLEAVLRGRPSPGNHAKAPVWRIRSSIPASWRSRIASALPDGLVADLTTRLQTRADWNTTRAFAITGENKGYIRFNMKGREKKGIVGLHEADNLASIIATGLLTFRDSDGSPTVARVERMSDLAGGAEFSEMLPDLVVYWGATPPVRVTHVESSLYGKVMRTGVGSGRSGNHVDDAWAVIAPGRNKARTLSRAVQVTDIAATACTLLGADTHGLSGESLLAAHR